MSRAARAPAVHEVRRALALRTRIAPKLRVGSSDDAAERDADAAARTVLGGGSAAPFGARGESAGRPVSPALAQRLQALDSGGQPLAAPARELFEPRFGSDFSAVRVHAGAGAASLASSLNARAFTLGPHVVFDRGEYAPETARGREVLAHELAHVVQQANGPEAGIVRRLSYSDVKEKVYGALISGLRTAQDATRNKLRKLAAEHVSAAHLPAANTLIDIVDAVIGALIAVILAVIGIVVGFGEGIVGMVKGLIDLALGVLKILYDLLAGIFTGFDDLKTDLNAVVDALKNLPAALKKLVTDWLDQFGKASSERQSLMIGELTGQVIALIATFAVAAGKAGTVAKIGGETGDVAGTAGKVGEVTGTAAKTRPVLTVIEGGGGKSGTVASASGTGGTIGNTALKLAPAADPVPAAAPLKLVPPVAAQDATAVAGTSSNASRRAAAAAAVAAAQAKKTSEGAEPFRMRFQVQWNTNNGGPTFSEKATAQNPPGVTTEQAVAALDTVVASVTPNAARKAAQPAADQQRKWIRGRPPQGVSDIRSWSKYFDYGGYTDARVDVENQRGTNLRV